MNTLATRLGVLAIADVVILYGCGDNSDSPAGPKSVKSTSLAAQSACGEVSYLSELSPVLFVWEDDRDLPGDGSNAPPEDRPVHGRRPPATLARCSSGEAAINDTPQLPCPTPLPTDPAQTEHQEYHGASPLSLKADLEANRGVTFPLPASPDARRWRSRAADNHTCAGAEGMSSISRSRRSTTGSGAGGACRHGQHLPAGATEVTHRRPSGNSPTHVR
jgi:hypothetical protein